MPINLSVPETSELKPRITVFGVGGAGGNAVNNMIESELEGVEFVVANTDAQAIRNSKAERRIQMGSAITEGLGAGSQPEVGRAAAEESLEEILEHMGGAHMAFITAGMGGGTGTGAAPVIARAARERDILTVGVVTKPFHFEGARRMRLAEAGIQELQKYVDTLLIIPNQNLFRIANEKTTFAQAFAMADQVLHSGVRGITDLMIMPGLINLDFADVRTVMNEMGKAMMGTGEAEGEKRAIEAAEAAISNPLLDEVSMKGARGVLINITGGMDMTLFEVDEAANRIRGEVDPDANIIVGSTFDDALDGKMRVSVVATGIESAVEHAPEETTAAGGTTIAAPKTAPWRQPAPAADAPNVAPGAVVAAQKAAANLQIARKDMAPNPVREAQRVLKTQMGVEDAPGPQTQVPQGSVPPVSDQPTSAQTTPVQASAPETASRSGKSGLDDYVEEQPLAAEPRLQPAPASEGRDVGRPGGLSFNPFRRSAGDKLGDAARELLRNVRGDQSETPAVTAPQQTEAPAVRRAQSTRVAPPQDKEAEPRIRPSNGQLFPSDQEDEQLEIPAFLRRSAN
ncbi:MAG: cell division protein FtsZ [Pseudomonadota bacterium]